MSPSLLAPHFQISAHPRAILLFLAATITACGSGGSTTPPTRIPNFVRLQSDPGDPVGQGKTYEYTQANALITVEGVDQPLITVDGDQWWQAGVSIPDGGLLLHPGTYNSATWGGEQRGCSGPTGIVTIDSVTYADSALAAIDFRLDQQCDGATGALHATVHWRADDPTTFPGPVTPIPTTLWKPDPSLTPALGNYVALVSDPGDFVGQGATRMLTTSYGPIVATVVNGWVAVTVGGAGG